MSTGITLSEAELIDITGYEQATKQLRVLHSRGFLRAFIDRRGEVVLERTHYEAVTKGQAPVSTGSSKAANLTFLHKAA